MIGLSHTTIWRMTKKGRLTVTLSDALPTRSTV